MSSEPSTSASTALALVGDDAAKKEESLDEALANTKAEMEKLLNQ